MTPEEFRRTANVSRETIIALERYHELILRWQSKMNLIAESTKGDIWGRHFSDSAQLAKYALQDPPNLRGTNSDAAPGKKIYMDLGSGAGFPGLILALLGARPLHLVEANGRKATFLAEAARYMGLDSNDYVVHPVRVDALDQEFAGRAAVVTARALANLNQLLGMAAPLLAPEGICVFPKGRAWRQELAAAQQNWTMLIETFDSESDREAAILRISDLHRK